MHELLEALIGIWDYIKNGDGKLDVDPTNWALDWFGTYASIFCLKMFDFCRSLSVQARSAKADWTSRANAERNRSRTDRLFRQRLPRRMEHRPPQSSR